MTRIYEALERLEDRSRKSPKQAEPISERNTKIQKYEVLHPVPVENGSENGNRELQGIYSGLIFRIDASLKQNGENNIVQIVGSRSGEGSSTIARELAKTAVLEFGRTVLLIEMDNLGNSQFGHFADLKTQALPAGEISENLEQKIFPKKKNDLHMTALSSSDVAKISSSKNGLPSPLDRLRSNYDIIIIDSPPIEHNQSNPFFHLAGGIILVVEAEKTKHQVVKRSKELIEHQEGNFIGIVLNKKKYHIPKWIYKKL